MCHLRTYTATLLIFLILSTFVIPYVALLTNHLVRSGDGSQYNGLFVKCADLHDNSSLTACGLFHWSDHVKDSAAAARVKSIQALGVLVLIIGLLAMVCVSILQALLFRSKSPKMLQLLNRGLLGVVCSLLLSVVLAAITCALLAVNVDEIAVFPDAQLGWSSYLLMASSATAVVCYMLFFAWLHYLFRPAKNHTGSATSTAAANSASPSKIEEEDTAPPISDQTPQLSPVAMRHPSSDVQGHIPCQLDITNVESASQLGERADDTKSDNLNVFTKCDLWLIDKENYKRPSKSIQPKTSNL